MLEGWRTNKARFLSSLLRPIPSARSHEVALEGCGNREEALGQRKRTDQTPTAILDPVAPHRARSSRPRIQTVVVCECVPQHKTVFEFVLLSVQYTLKCFAPNLEVKLVRPQRKDVGLPTIQFRSHFRPTTLWSARLSFVSPLPLRGSNLSLFLARGIAIVPSRQNRTPFSSLQHGVPFFSLHLVPLQ
jgi:hypothetical protein